MDLKTLVNKEYKECKQRMIKETTGLYVLIYIGVGFSVFFSAMFGFRYGYEDFIFLFTVYIMYDALYQVLTMYTSTVKENGIRQDIFAKYIYTPIEPKILVLAKLMVNIRITAIPIVLSQLMALAVRAIDPDKDGGSFADISVWTPVIYGVIILLLDAISYKIKCDKAMGCNGSPHYRGK